MECGNRLRVGVLVLKTLGCRGWRVGPSKGRPQDTSEAHRPPHCFIWGAANGGLRDGGLRKSEDIWGKRPFSSVFWIFQVLFRPSGKAEKRAKKADFGRFPGGAARHLLNPHLLHPHLRQPSLCVFCLSVFLLPIFMCTDPRLVLRIARPFKMPHTLTTVTSLHLANAQIEVWIIM